MKKILFMLLGLVLWQGCRKDFLDTKPRDSYSNTTLWTSKADAISALAGVYNGWESGDNIFYDDCMSDNAYNQFIWDGYEKFASGISTAVDPGVNFYHYKSIQRANWFLENVDKVPGNSLNDETKNRMKGEARFIRAYQYFLLSWFYGDVPLVERSLTITEANTISQTPKKEVVAYVLKELNEIAPLLPVSYSNQSDIGRITRGAALALKARLELYEGKFLDCIATSQQLMKAPFDYGIYPNFENLFRPQFVDPPNNKEVILSIQYLINNNSLSLIILPPPSQGGWSSITPTQSLVDEFETKNGKTIKEDNSYDSLQPYKNRDPRLDQSIIRPGLFYMGSYFNPFSDTDKKGANNASPTGYNFKKYIADINDYRNTEYGVNIENTGGSIIVIRYAEVLLTYAEAKIELNQIDASVYKAITDIRKRTSINMPEARPDLYPDQESLRKLVRRERRVELAGEGLRWFDIKRWKIAPKVMNATVYGALDGIVDKSGNLTLKPNTRTKVATRHFEEKNYLLPIPYQELTINKNLVQTPGY